MQAEVQHKNQLHSIQLHTNNTLQLWEIYHHPGNLKVSSIDSEPANLGGGGGQPLNQLRFYWRGGSPHSQNHFRIWPEDVRAAWIYCGLPDARAQ